MKRLSILAAMIVMFVASLTAHAASTVYQLNEGWKFQRVSVDV